MSSTVHGLLDIVAACQPGLTGRIGPSAPGELICGAEANAPLVTALHEHWRDAHPEAGPLYWSARSWSQLVWQPVFLTVLSVHLGGLVPRLAHVGQSLQGGAVFGFSLPAHGFRATSSADPATLIPFAARQLRAWLARQWQEATGVFFMHARVANRLAADLLMAALLLVQRRSALGNDALRELAARWLSAMHMDGCSSLVDVPLDDGRTALALGRKICCQHFRRADSAPCTSCPKLPIETRMVLLRQELST
ncbi:MAG: siderophore ferric iron reductase [Polaromonas sp.]|nr:siderophore ferric iron reductase [Polaromonas sp.]